MMNQLGSLFWRGRAWAMDTGRTIVAMVLLPGQPERGSAKAIDQGRLLPALLLVAVLGVAVSMNAHAQAVGTTTTGDTLWSELKTLWFGAPGLIVGAICLIIGVLGFFRNGFGWSAIVFGICAVFFLIPGIVISFQRWAQTIAG